MNQRVTGWLISIAMVGLFAASTAWAGPPFFTDDPEPVPLHHWEFYVASMLTHTADDTTATAPHFEVNYGALPNLQLHLLAPLVYDSPSGGRDRYGYGDTELGFKYRFFDETETLPMVGVFPLVELPTGDESRGLGNGKVQAYIPIWLQKSFGKWTTYGGAGYWFNHAPGARDHWFAGWELQRQMTDQLMLGGEIYYMSPDADGASQHIGFNLGGVYDITENHHILFSAGRDFTGDAHFQAYLGYQLTF